MHKSDNLRSCWWNCYSPEDKSFLEDKELLAIDAMEDSIAPLDDQTVAIRQLITRFELCYHEADKEAERIAKAIGSGRCPKESHARPAKRKKELQNCRRILSRWCKNTAIRGINLDVGGVPADELLSFIGEPSPLCDRMKIISNTLGAFWKNKKTAKKIDRDILISLGQATPVKYWLAASLDKTIRLHLSLPFDTDLS